MTTPDLTIRPFEVHVPDGGLADLRRRSAATRWPGKGSSRIGHRACSWRRSRPWWPTGTPDTT